MKKKLLLYAILLLPGAQLYAQETGIAHDDIHARVSQEPVSGSIYGQEARTPYYLDINKAGKSTVHDIQDAWLSVQYHDLYGKDRSILLKAYDWQHREVGAYSLAKTYGANYFNIHLGALFTSWNAGEIYVFEMADEAHRKYEVRVRKAPPDKERPSVNLFVNPVHLSCSETTGNSVDFYGTVKGGKAPYKVSWYILNDQRTAFLYQPREEIIAGAGDTMVVRVDRDPDYYVLLHVRDACGNEQKQMVHLVCRESEKKVNTLFVEPLERLPARATNVVN